LTLQLIAQAVLGAELARFADAPLAEVASRMLGPWAYSLMLVGGSVSMLGYLSGDALGTPRNLFAFARDGLLPRALARLHPTYRTPWVSILSHAVIAWAAASVGTFGVLALLSNVALLTSYFLCCAAAIELRRRDVRSGGTPFTVPGGPVVPIAACLVVAWLLSHASVQEFAVTGAAMVAAVVLYSVRGARRRSARTVATGEEIVGG
jgi:amino acid transporter